ncbi:MAG: hypothetical protein ACFFC7_16110 [Candidatus Hermodarchaeota archaeon]
MSERVPEFQSSPSFLKEKVERFRKKLEIYSERIPTPIWLSIKILNHAIKLTDHYTNHKLEAEKEVQQSNLPWTILRFGAVIPIEFSLNFNPNMYEIPLDQRIEFLHPSDAGLGCANAVKADTTNKILYMEMNFV